MAGTEDRGVGWPSEALALVNPRLNFDDDSEDRSPVLEQDDEIRPELSACEPPKVAVASSWSEQGWLQVGLRTKRRCPLTPGGFT